MKVKFDDSIMKTDFLLSLERSVIFALLCFIDY